nr:hypothetical protein [Cressdnaviricota sp.]UOF78319.1 hypothetical protein [Cressdnaviricota sp.]
MICFLMECNASSKRTLNKTVFQVPRRPEDRRWKFPEVIEDIKNKKKYKFLKNYFLVYK